MNIKRRVIQIANSTQLISLPRKWSQKYNIKKGDELEIEENGSKLNITTGSDIQVETVELNIDELEPMIVRYLNALYKRGVDQVKLTFSNPGFLSSIQEAIGKEAVGFEITEQGNSYCIIKHVSGELEDFDSVLRRTFLQLISLANQSLESIKNNELKNLQNVAFLEEANNRFTTTCRRYLNKKGYKDSRKIGPLYYIIEEIENIADEYKYLCDHIYGMRNKKNNFNKEVLKIYQDTNDLLQNFYEIFYKYDKHKLVQIGKKRKELVGQFLNLLDKPTFNNDKIIIYHLFTIMQKIFCLVGPYLVINYES